MKHEEQIKKIQGLEEHLEKQYNRTFPNTAILLRSVFVDEDQEAAAYMLDRVDVDSSAEIRLANEVGLFMKGRLGEEPEGDYIRDYLFVEHDPKIGWVSLQFSDRPRFVDISGLRYVSDEEVYVQVKTSADTTEEIKFYLC